MPSRFLTRKRLIGMVHLLPLPGSPGYGGDWNAVRERALADAWALAEGGVSALLIENFGDRPFLGDRVEPITVAAMAALVQEVRSRFGLPCGVNVLRNDAAAALAIATVTGCPFIRVNIHLGTMLTDQGLLSGQGAQTLRRRTAWRSSVEVWADVWVKHAAPLGTASLEETALDTWERGLADALILSGQRTGQPPEGEALNRVRQVLPQAPLVVGSGLTPENLETFWPYAQGFIVGTWLKEGEDPQGPVSLRRVRQLVERWRALLLAGEGEAPAESPA